MENTPRFSASGWDFPVFSLTLALGYLCFGYDPGLSLFCWTLGMVLLFLRQRNADHHNAQHDFAQRMPAGSKFNYTFFVILFFSSVWLAVWMFFAKPG